MMPLGGTLQEINLACSSGGTKTELPDNKGGSDMAFKLVHTMVFETRVSMRYADEKDSEEWIDFQVNISNLRLPHPVADSHRRSLGVLQRAALEFVRDFLSKEQQSRAGL
jgi:hypothetical protein